MSNLIYPDLSYAVQGAFYDVYNELRYLELSEEGWENALLIALAERQLSAQRQVEYELRYQGYRIGRFFMPCTMNWGLVLCTCTIDEPVRLRCDNEVSLMR